MSALTRTVPASAGAGASPFAGGVLDQVGLVERDEARLVAGAQLVEDRLDRCPVLAEVRIGRVDDLEQDVGPVDLLERRPERVDELVGQLVDETDRVGDDRDLAVAELHLARRRVERREQHVLGLRDLAADERVEQRRLAGVRVADDADRRIQPAVAAARRGRALLADLLDALLHLRDPGPDDPPVGLELALAGASRADAATGPRQVGPEPRQARQLVLELGELDLEAALVGLGVEGEDVEDQPAAVDDLDVEQALERLLLAGRQLVVGDEHVEAGLALGPAQLLGLALADVPVGVDVAAVLPLRADDVGAGRRREVGELGQGVLGGPAVVVAGVDRDEERLLGGRGEIDQLGVAHGRLKCSPGAHWGFVATIPLGAASLGVEADEAPRSTQARDQFVRGDATGPRIAWLRPVQPAKLPLAAESSGRSRGRAR